MPRGSGAINRDGGGPAADLGLEVGDALAQRIQFLAQCVVFLARCEVDALLDVFHRILRALHGRPHGFLGPIGVQVTGVADITDRLINCILERGQEPGDCAHAFTQSLLRLFLVALPFVVGCHSVSVQVSRESSRMICAPSTLSRSSMRSYPRSICPALKMW